jgi:hypothetical protein
MSTADITLSDFTGPAEHRDQRLDQRFVVQTGEKVTFRVKKYVVWPWIIQSGFQGLVNPAFRPLRFRQSISESTQDPERVRASPAESRPKDEQVPGKSRARNGRNPAAKPPERTGTGRRPWISWNSKKPG